MISKDANRNYMFDNLKVLLIFLVVVGHLLRRHIDGDTALSTIYFFIYIFHMPLFVYVSGYFSKNIEKCRKNSVRDLLVPFIVFNTIWYIIKGNSSFPIYYAGWGLWYLLCLFIWRRSLIYLVKVKWVVWLSVIAGLLAGIVVEHNDLLSFARVFSYLPFFLLGYYSNDLHMERIKRLPKIISVLGLAAIGAFAFLVTKFELVNYRFLYLSRSYESLDMGTAEGIMLRVLFYAIAMAAGVFLMNIVSGRELIISKIGSSTLIVYLGHLYIVKLLDRFLPVFDSTIVNLSVIVALSVLIVGILSLPVFAKAYKRVFEKIYSI